MGGKTSRKHEAQAAVWGIEEIREIVDLLSERGISEFEMEKNGFRVRIKRGVVVEQVHAAAGSPLDRPAEAQAEPAVHPVHATESPGSLKAEAVAESHEHLHVIKSPIVGTFYSAPSPDAPPYVKVGDRVQKDQVLCIIEAMKLMNEIEADDDGEITEIYVQNGQPVEYGQPLFALLVSS